MKKKYEERFKNAIMADDYSRNVYAKNSYYSLMWNIEKIVLEREIVSINKKNIKYLDFACGTGRVISYVENFVESSHGIDISQEMLNIASKKTKINPCINRAGFFPINLAPGVKNSMKMIMIPIR